jgi:TolB-like protein/class 3 adenylate cyclase/cytochrome c-type biogenesis protein CcmH/NrfG
MVAPDRRLKPIDTALAKRKLTAILAADVEGYSRLMEADEAGTHATLTAYRSVLADSIAEHDGRIVGTAGDSVLADFPSVVEALNAAVEIQKEFAERNAELPAERRLRFRIGINLGDVIVDGEDIFGDGVNVAARVQALAEPGGIAVSGAVYDQVRNKLDLGFRDRGAHRVKNIAEPVRVYGVLPESRAMRRMTRVGRSIWYVAISAGAAMVVLAVVLTVWVRWPETQRADQAEPSSLTEAGTTGDLSEAHSAIGATPTIAVLPFDNQGGNPEQDYFSEGITEDIISALGRFSSLLVMSWDAVAPYKGQTVTPDQLSEDLNVRYVVDGSVRRAGDQLRVTTRLTDAERGVLLWSERYDRTVDDVFAVQDDITRQIVSTLAIRVTYLEQERAFGKPTDNLSAYDYYLRGRQSFRQFTRAANVRAQELFGRAIELDPNYGDAYAALAWTYTKSAEMGWTEWPDRALERAHNLAQTAVRLDSSNQLAHIVLALVYTYRQNYQLALEELDRAAQANPNHAGNHAERGWVLLIAGRSGDAITALEEAMRFDPSPTPNTFSNLAIAYHLQGRYNDAIRTAEGAVGRYPHHVSLYTVLAAAYAEVGRMNDARRAAADLHRHHPFFEVDSFGLYFRDPAERDRIHSSLRKAGL